jgi:aspartate/methionine/tyrosine aminotransferase
MPDTSVGEILRKCSLATDCLNEIILKDNDTRGAEKLRNAISKTYDGKISDENIICTTGTSEGLFILFNILMENKKNAVVPFPSFQSLYDVPRAVGAETRLYHLSISNEFLPDADEICSLIDDNTGFVVINTPHNPSGRIIDLKSSEKIIEKAGLHGAYVISDEHYRFLPLNGESILKSLAGHSENVFATGSVTKCFGMAGLRTGWIVSPPDFVKKICDFRDYLTHTLSPVSDFLASSVLENAPLFIENNIAVLKINLNVLMNEISRTPSLTIVKPDAGVVAFPSYSFKMSSDDFATGLIREKEVFVLPGSSFETEGQFRINLGMNPVRFADAALRIGDYCRRLEKVC